jgi:hypothetical protein
MVPPNFRNIISQRLKLTSHISAYHVFDNSANARTKVGNSPVSRFCLPGNFIYQPLSFLKPSVSVLHLLVSFLHLPVRFLHPSVRFSHLSVCFPKQFAYVFKCW